LLSILGAQQRLRNPDPALHAERRLGGVTAAAGQRHAGYRLQSTSDQVPPPRDTWLGQHRDMRCQRRLSRFVESMKEKALDSKEKAAKLKEHWK